MLCYGMVTWDQLQTALEDLFDRGVDGVGWWSALVNLRLSFLLCISMGNDHLSLAKPPMSERIPFYLSLSSKHHFAPLFQSYWEETLVWHSKHKHKNKNKKQANKQTLTQKGLLYLCLWKRKLWSIIKFY